MGNGGGGVCVMADQINASILRVESILLEGDEGGSYGLGNGGGEEEGGAGTGL